MPVRGAATHARCVCVLPLLNACCHCSQRASIIHSVPSTRLPSVWTSSKFMLSIPFQWRGAFELIVRVESIELRRFHISRAQPAMGALFVTCSVGNEYDWMSRVESCCLFLKIQIEYDMSWMEYDMLSTARA